MLRDGGTYVEMGQFTDAGAIETNWHRICTKDLTIVGSWAFTGNDIPSSDRPASSSGRQVSLGSHAGRVSADGGRRGAGSRGRERDEGGEGYDQAGSVGQRTVRRVELEPALHPASASGRAFVLQKVPFS